MGPYFELLEIPVVAGRELTDQDAAEGGVVLVNEAAAEKYWPGQSPIGSRMKRGGPDSEQPWLTVVGVVGDVAQRGGGSDPEPEFFHPYEQGPIGIMTVVAKVQAGMVLPGGAVRAAVRDGHRSEPSR